ncbi:hypothetical protein ABT075_24785 [Streptomyces sp. NPDC002677]|uniref:hypothetical protein n=1 Tax=Streptomyces sp. NPDC002677 TaxID=3154774 RepID=UPI0033285164
MRTELKHDRSVSGGVDGYSLMFRVTVEFQAVDPAADDAARRTAAGGTVAAPPVFREVRWHGDMVSLFHPQSGVGQVHGNGQGEVGRSRAVAHCLISWTPLRRTISPRGFNLHVDP